MNKLTGSQKFFLFLLIFVFAGAITAIGAHELNTRFKIKKGKGRANPEMVRELHGDVDMSRGSLSRRAQATEETRSNTVQSAKDGANDLVDSTDKKELKELIDKLVP